MSKTPGVRLNRESNKSKVMLARVQQRVIVYIAWWPLMSGCTVRTCYSICKVLNSYISYYLL